MSGDSTKDHSTPDGVAADDPADVVVDPDAALRACQVAAARARRWAVEQADSHHPSVVDVKEHRRLERARLRAEALRVATELAMLEAEEAAELEREEQDRLAQAKLEEKLLRAAEALEEERRRELEEIDLRLEARFGDAPAAAPQPGSAPPPPPPRRKARLRVSASVLIDHFGTLVALPLVNVSLTGALIATTDIERPKLRVGQLLLITFFATADVQRQVDLVARVVRRTETEAAVDWSGDESAQHGIAVLLDELTSEPST